MWKLFANLPDGALDWSGTAAELADKCNELAPCFGLDPKKVKATERLVRYYLDEGILTAPEREGREAIFAGHAILEFIVARQLRGDKWPLAKISDVIPTMGLREFAESASAARGTTPAQEAIAKIRGQAPQRAAHITSPPAQAAQASNGPESTLGLEDLASQSLSKWDLSAALRALGNTAGEPDVTAVLNIELTPWCQVHVDLSELRRSGPEAPAVLGEALANALQKERHGRGRLK
jgi:hypothetical protein